MATIHSLRSQSWSDRQIANYFNETGYLTPRGHRWLPQSVFSIRKKYEKRLERIGGG
ncbi:MAG: recombinase family protein [Methylophilaceae bacterium]